MSPTLTPALSRGEREKKRVGDCGPGGCSAVVLRHANDIHRSSASMPGLPPLHALRAFEAAARHLSFARAAAELNLTPSAISHQIRHLEESLGRRLFERRPRSLELTPLGKVYFPLVRNAFEQLAQATALIGGAGPERRLLLSLNCLSYIAIGLRIPSL